MEKERDAAAILAASAPLVETLVKLWMQRIGSREEDTEDAEFSDLPSMVSPESVCANTGFETEANVDNQDVESGGEEAKGAVGSEHSLLKPAGEQAGEKVVLLEEKKKGKLYKVSRVSICQRQGLYLLSEASAQTKRSSLRCHRPISKTISAR